MAVWYRSYRLYVVHITPLDTALEMISHTRTSCVRHSSKDQKPFCRDFVHYSCNRKTQKDGYKAKWCS